MRVNGIIGLEDNSNLIEVGVYSFYINDIN